MLCSALTKKKPLFFIGLVLSLVGCSFLATPSGCFIEMHYRCSIITGGSGRGKFSARTREGSLCHAACCTFDLLLDAARASKPTVVREIVIEGSDITDLFVNYLREILYLFNGTGVRFDGRPRQEIDNHHLVGRDTGVDGLMPGSTGSGQKSRQ